MPGAGVRPEAESATLRGARGNHKLSSFCKASGARMTPKNVHSRQHNIETPTENGHKAMLNLCLHIDQYHAHQMRITAQSLKSTWRR